MVDFYGEHALNAHRLLKHPLKVLAFITGHLMTVNSFDGGREGYRFGIMIDELANFSVLVIRLSERPSVDLSLIVVDWLRVQLV